MASSVLLSTSASRMPPGETTQDNSLTGPSDSDGGFRLNTSLATPSATSTSRPCRGFMPIRQPHPAQVQRGTRLPLSGGPLLLRSLLRGRLGLRLSLHLYPGLRLGLGFRLGFRLGLRLGLLGATLRHERIALADHVPDDRARLRQPARQLLAVDLRRIVVLDLRHVEAAR